MSELISVVMPVYNASAFLRETLDSVLTQTYSQWELIAVNDCSTDDSLRILREYEQRDARVHVLSMAQNSGVAKVRNFGIQAAKGAYIALLDSDDVWVKEKLERQLCLAKHTQAQILYASYDFIDEKGKEVKKPFVVPKIVDYHSMLGKSVIGCSAAMVESWLLQSHPFDNRFYHEDYVLWMELLSLPGVKAAGDTAVLMHYRQVQGSRSNHKGNAARQRWKIYREALGLNLLQSATAFTRYAINGVLKYYL